jgi:hypothetical protein
MSKEEPMNKVLLITVAAGLFATSAMAAERSVALKAAVAPVDVKADENVDLANVSGTVIVTKDKKTGEATDLDLMTSGGFKFKITRDSESKYLEAKNGESMDLAGLITQKDGQKWVTIKKPTVISPVDDKAGEGKTVKNAERAAKKEQKEKKPGRKVSFGY